LRFFVFFLLFLSVFDNIPQDGFYTNLQLLSKTKPSEQQLPDGLFFGACKT